MDKKFKVLVLGGGPDLEREVSLLSSAAVAQALRDAGHDVTLADISPVDTAALKDDYDVIFPVLHGPFGEGGPLQDILEARGLPYVGCGPAAARTAMDKVATKRVAIAHGIPTPEYQVLGERDAMEIAAPLVLKPVDEGSSLGVEICRTEGLIEQARGRLHPKHGKLLVERFIDGREITVGIVADQVLPPILIVPAAKFYDYEAKYISDQTKYLFETGLSPDRVNLVQSLALKLYKAIGCRHISRVDFIVDGAGDFWLLEINTMPGFTSHSLVPMGAAKAGMAMPALCDRLVRLAHQEAAGR